MADSQPISTGTPRHRPYVPETMEMKEFTVRAVIIGLFMTVILGAANAYLGLRAGMKMCIRDRAYIAFSSTDVRCTACTKAHAPRANTSTRETIRMFLFVASLLMKRV